MLLLRLLILTFHRLSFGIRGSRWLLMGYLELVNYGLSSNWLHMGYLRTGYLWAILNWLIIGYLRIGYLWAIFELVTYGPP